MSVQRKRIISRLIYDRFDEMRNRLKPGYSRVFMGRVYSKRKNGTIYSWVYGQPYSRKEK